MKTCPVCSALCFDDMPVCYGCMHSFERDGLRAEGGSDSAADVDADGESGSADASGAAKGVQRGGRGMSFVEAKPASGLRIPMVTCVAPEAASSDSKDGSPRAAGPDSSAPSAFPSCLTIEAPAGCRVVLRLE